MRVKPERELMVFIPPPLHIFGMGGGRKKIWSAMKQFWRKNPGKNFHRKDLENNLYFQCSIFFLILQRLEGVSMKIEWTSGGIMVLYIFEYLRHSERSEAEWRILVSIFGTRSWIKFRMTGKQHVQRARKFLLKMSEIETKIKRRNEPYETVRRMRMRRFEFQVRHFQ